jgi:outer membrane receptor for ferrienterochelin and colicin
MNLKHPFTQLFVAFFVASISNHGQSEEQFFELSLFELQDIPVEVASLFEDSTLDVASSTASISRSEWQNRGAISLGQALEGVPSVFTSTVWGGSEAIAIRGFATELSVRGVAQSLDGIPLGSYTYASPSYLLPRAPLNLLNRVEMIRGPGSTLYGNDAFHGVISMELFNRATNTGEAFVQAGTPGSYEVTAVNSYNNDKWHVHTGGSITVDGDHDLTYTFTDPYTADTIGNGTREQGTENASAFLKASYGTVSGKRGKFGFTLFRNDFEATEFQGVGTQFYTGIPASFDVESSSIAGAGDTSNGKNELSLMGLSHEVLLDNGIQLKNHIYHWQCKQEWAFDNSNYPDELIFRPDFFVPSLAGTTQLCQADESSDSKNPLYCPHTLFQGTDESRTGFYTQVKQAVNRFNTQWVVGAGVDRIKITDGRFERINEQGITSQLSTSSYIGSDRELGHILAQARSGFLNNRLLITYGARWDYYSDVKNHISPRLGLVYKTTDALTQKILFGHAYRAPTALEQFGSGSVLGDINLKSETIETYEFINIYRQPNYEVEAVLFFSEWDNAISLVEVTSVQNQYKNNDYNESKGLELSIRSKIQSTTINAQTSYTKSENTTDSVDYVAFPEWMASVNIEHPVIPEKLTMGLWQRAMLSYQLNDTDTTTEKESYYRTDLYLNWRMDARLSVIANIQNVFDTENTLPSYYGSEGGLKDYGQIIKASIKYKL